jgi:hypothetical protein
VGGCGDEIHILYGGGDTFVMAATVSKGELMQALLPVAAGEPL